LRALLLPPVTRLAGATGSTKWYLKHKIGRWSDANPEGRLIVSEDSPAKRLNSAAIRDLTRRLDVRGKGRCRNYGIARNALDYSAFLDNKRSGAAVAQW
jgi:hypothetical protein